MDLLGPWLGHVGFSLDRRPGTLWLLFVVELQTLGFNWDRSSHVGLDAVLVDRAPSVIMHLLFHAFCFSARPGGRAG